ncbi:hypothetical protein [Anaerolentibacter hominis]
MYEKYEIVYRFDHYVIINRGNGRVECHCDNYQEAREEMSLLP